MYVRYMYYENTYFFAMPHPTYKTFQLEQTPFNRKCLWAYPHVWPCGEFENWLWQCALHYRTNTTVVHFAGCYFPPRICGSSTLYKTLFRLLFSIMDIMETWRKRSNSWLAREFKFDMTTQEGPQRLVQTWSRGNPSLRSQEHPLSFLGGHNGDMEEKEHFLTS